MLHAEAFAKKAASVRSIVVEKTMQPHCNLQDHFEHVPRISLKKQLQLRVLRGARQSRRRKRAGVRRGIPTYRFRWPERPRREPRRRVVTPFYNNKMCLSEMQGSAKARSLWPPAVGGRALPDQADGARVSNWRRRPHPTRIPAQIQPVPPAASASKWSSVERPS